MAVIGFDHVGVVVDDLDAAVAFFVALGFEREGSMSVGGDWVDRVLGISGVESDVIYLRAPGVATALELSRFRSPAASSDPNAGASNVHGYRHIALPVDDIETAVRIVRSAGYETVSDIVDYEDVYRLVYVRGPEGLIVELAERVG